MGRVAVVTGANHGIGAAVALALARSGTDVAVSYLRYDIPPSSTPYDLVRAETGAGVVAGIRDFGRKAIELEVDLASSTASESIFDAVETELGPVDILINNASAWVADTFGARASDRLGRQLAPVGEDTFDRVFAVDARASALMIAEYARRHRDHDLGWGRIVSLSSGGPKGFPEEVSYGAAKAALENLTMSAAFELGERGVTANVVHPPVTDTGWVDDGVRRAVASSRDMFHVATPDQVAEVVTFLCSDSANLVTANRIKLR
ncbi:MAG: SDR family oxidoreductase [Acidimicrobiia bacterium]